MASADIDALVDLRMSERSVRPYAPPDRAAEDAKTQRLRALRLAKETATKSRRAVRTPLPHPPA